MLVLCGTNRPGANTRKVSNHILELLKAPLNKTSLGSAKMIDLGEFSADIYSPEAYATKPAWFQKYQDLILSAKGMIIVTPEYNGSFPGVLKYFIDMLKFPESLVGLPVAFVGVGAGQFGALRSVEQLMQILTYRNAHIFGPKLYVPRVHELIAPDGSLGEQEERLKALVESFVEFVEKYRA